MINRRHFLLSISGAIVATALPNAIAQPSGIDLSYGQSSQQSTQQKFQNIINDTFLLRNKNGSHWLTLKKVEVGPEHDGMEQFQLVFTSDSPNFTDDIYSVTHLSTLQTQKMNIEASQSMKQHYVSTFCLLT
ncbi:DUF6916 family protein [Colwellia psychrerythraea]|uniref:Tat (Twin-arginine translocation) pathway signal sequence domain protein n=1 Tax=Colwellia psychrerythraea (strain 34H / ATCC BAA-681) TaxID=167879 RepID=Q47VU8_COLP3|nr:hypothetical protein [Colwellia psychrerythraea]AAZ26315.1 Tat (twin-arginine translocation) pathway signal sequence domain protein [Colwellia psychrerythraea 34H]